MKKRVLSTLMALCMVFTLVPGEAWAEGDVASEGVVPLSDISTYGSLSYRINTDNTIAIVDCDETVVSIQIPALIDGMTVTSITNQAFMRCYNLTHITIPSSITSIDDAVFLDCNKLTSAGPIGGGYSYEFGWTEAIPQYAFAQCTGLTSITIPSSVTSIGNNAFWDCTSLESVNIPDSITTIGTGAFLNCANLSTINLPDSINSIGDATFRGCNSLTNINIPNGVTSIGNLMFYNCESLISITLPDSITDIGDSAFGNCKSLLSIDIPNSVATIGCLAFYSCNSLTSIDIPDSVTDIGCLAFAFCDNLTSIKVPNSVEDMWRYTDSYPNGGYIFGSPQLKTVGPIGGDYNIQLGWTEAIPSGAFRRCTNITNVTIPSSITYIMSSAFAECTQLSDIIIPDSVTNIGATAFAGCGFNSIALPHSLTHIGERAFRECTNLVSIDIPDGITDISREMFYLCENLTSINIPRSVTHIGKDAFTRTGLTDVYYAGSQDDWQAIDINLDSVYGDNSGNTLLLNATIHYNSTGPDDPGTQGAEGILRSGDGWKMRWKCNYKEDANGNPSKGSIEITVNDTNDVEELYVYDDSGLAGFPWEREPYNIPKSAIETLIIRGTPTKKLRVAENSFQDYTGLKTAVFDFVSGIDSYAFEGCTALESVGFLNEGSGFTAIGNGAFRNCTSLVKMDFPGSLQSIGDEAFKNSALGTITLGTNITEIGEEAFSGCENVKIRGYENSVAHKYAIENSIPFEPISETSEHTNIYYGNGNVESFEHNLDYYVSRTASTAYDPALAHMLMSLSYAAYNRNDTLKSFKSLGFASGDTLCEIDDNQEWDSISYTFGKKTLPDGQKLVLIAIKGSSEFGFHYDWLSNAMIVPKGGFAGWHLGFDTAASEVWAILETFLKKDFSNTIFIVTGHSRGAATANLIEVKLFEQKVPQSKVYGYNFACPDVAVAIPTMWNWLGEHDNIFNINAAGDPVSLLPGMIGSALTITGTDWGKFGQSRWFAHDWHNSEELSCGFEHHAPAEYLKYLKKEESYGKLKTWEDRTATLMSNNIEDAVGNMFGVSCPVDVNILNSDGQIIASVTSGVVNYHDSIAGEVLILTDGDRKSIYVRGNNPLTLQLSATDVGTMNYTVQTINFDTGEILSEKSFDNVELIKGKEMLSLANVEEVTGIGIDVSKVPLYVLDRAGALEKEVLPDGNGTEVPITKPDNPNTPDTPETPDDPTTTYTITFNPNGGSVSAAEITTSADGKLSTLPIPSRIGYTFMGWFTAPSGGTAITVNTIFNDNTTVYAQWRYNGGGGSTGGDNWIPSDNSDSSSSGNSAATSYSITTPFVTGGTITVSPRSATKGSTVTITATPDTGYTLTSLIVKDNTGKEVELTDKGNGKYTFVMPGSKITIDASFQLTQDAEPSTEVVPWNNPFADVSAGAWYYDAVEFVGSNSLMNGISTNTFAPDANLSRAMLAQILYNKEERPVTTTNGVFADVANNAWYADAVAWAATSDIVKGYGNDLFGPKDNITREQLAVMLWRYEKEPAATISELQFSDAGEISSYALDAMRWAIENGIINGKGNGVLDPRGLATRAQVAQMLKNYLDK